MSAARWRVAIRRVRTAEALAVVCLALFVALAVAMRGAAGESWDLAVTRAVQGFDQPAVAWAMTVVSVFGFAPINYVLYAAAVLGFWLRAQRREALYLLLSLGAGLVSALTKLLVHRPRPSPDLVEVASELLDYSYPSGHVVSYVSFFGFLFFLFYVLFRRGPLRTTMLWTLGLLVGLVGVSRVYLGHHWASDALGGYALGTGYLVLLIKLYHRQLTRSPSS